MPPIRFAIIDSNILACIGLQQLLTNLLPMADIVVFNSMSELRQCADDEYLHYFVSSRIYFDHEAFFRSQPKKTIVMVDGDMTINGINTLNVNQSEKTLVRDIMNLQGRGHGHAMAMARQSQRAALLSPRETEVAILLCKGYINKEIASQLDVSVATIITHRKNIMEKLHARSLADIIIYCIVNGIVNVENL